MTFKNELHKTLDFWLKTAIDTEYGGIFTSLDRAGNVYGEEKSVWFQGRALWTFSKAYNSFEKDPRYLEAAKTIYEFLPTCGDETGRMFFSVTREGKELQKRRYYFSETFAAIGCCEYYKATGLEEAWKKAEQYFDIAYNIYKNPSLTTPKLNPENAPMKAVSPTMILLNTAQILSTVGINREKYNAVVTECVNEILHGGYINTELGGMLEQVKTDGSFHDSPSGRVVNPGHSMECAWFLMAAGMEQKNEEAIRKGIHLMEMTMPLGWDKAHGGIIAFTDILGKPPLALEWDMKLWWPQCETIIAYRLAYMLTQKEAYLQTYQELCDYAFRYFADREHGEWYGYLHYDNTPANYLKGNLFKGPFHLPRMLMILENFEKDGNINRFLS